MNNELKLTPKQENFCLAYLETGNASEAYRRSYDCAGSSEPVINVNAKKLLDNAKITIRIAELRKPIIDRHNITVDDLLKEFDENRKIALSLETPQVAAANTSTMGKAKLLGHDKQLVELTGANGGAIQVNTTITPYEAYMRMLNG